MPHCTQRVASAATWNGPPVGGGKNDLFWSLAEKRAFNLVHIDRLFELELEPELEGFPLALALNSKLKLGKCAKVNGRHDMDGHRGK